MFEWTVIGAGPSGIAAVGKLLDQGVPSHQIAWIDPHFSVGDLGQKWNQVPSNTAVSLFLRFLTGCPSFEFDERPRKFSIETLDPKNHCLLQNIVEPLQWITQRLKQKIKAWQTIALSLNLSKGHWEIKTKDGSIASKNVILSIGSEPKALSYPQLETIPLDTALDPTKLAKAIGKQDTIAVFGSSHSAILVLANVLQLPMKGVLNFYRTPHRYAVFLKDWILYDNTGLKGFAAEWARKNIDGVFPAKLQRILTSDHLFDESLALCNKAVYCVGFERRKLPILEQYNHVAYDDRTGIIAPGLFGIGIAFPETKLDPMGHLEQRVGLWKFMDYLNTILPIWLKYANR